ncbi:unnamed protein product [Adineta ricciae]|uniref:Uncharacterized protein n=1 Tax=Adineta ricciae TaxID=249248 RepID=A0A815DHY7_ADIRI|nr:unnamed protein product [Adineta ricciae]CAF1293871.1 unnamed protein product [Adineta ricciae]
MFDPTLVLRFVLMAVTAATGVGVISAGITVGVIAAQQQGFLRESTTVFKSSAGIAVNRYIGPSEVPLFYDAVETMLELADSVKEVLREKYGDKFVNVEIVTFSATPNVTLNDSKTSPRDAKSAASGVESSAINLRTHNVAEIEGRQSNHDCKIDVDIINCTIESWDNKNCPPIHFRIDNCTDFLGNILECVNQTIPVYQCTNETQDIINCDGNITLRIPHHCYSGPNQTSPTNPTLRTTTSISSTSTQTTTTALSDKSTTTITAEHKCEAPANATGQRSIVFSTMYLYFNAKQSDAPLVDDIVAALKNIKPPIVLYNVCRTPSPAAGSYNSTLSHVAKPEKTNVELSAVQDKPSVSDNLKDTVNAEADAAKENILPPTSTDAIG